MTNNSFTKIEFIINGRKVQKEIPSSLLLLDLIREELSLKGTKTGCHEGECGACTVLINGEAINSCLYLGINIHGKEITTIEGLKYDGEQLDPVQKAMIDYGAVQCGFCTPGMIINIKSLISQHKANGSIANREEIKKAIEGNLCRCTGYTKIVDAVESLIKEGVA